jgi:asparagine synthase (glutamine-hydrolysing)
VSQLASRHRKVALGGQGGDEIFGGYTRYLLAYFEQCIKAAIDGTTNNGNFIVTYESIIPNLVALRNYKPMMQEFWRGGLFDEMDKRYFRLINRSPQLDGEVRWEKLGEYSPYESFRAIFNSSNVGRRSYFDLMTHFDFKTLLPALLQIEDRMSMAHGLESRVPLLDHPIVEFAATVPANVKFKDGTMKHLFKNTFHSYLPEAIVARQDKMGFPTPLVEWVRGDAREFVLDTLSSRAATERELVDNARVARLLEKEPRFGRKIWGLLSLEIWQQQFHDLGGAFKARLDRVPHAAHPAEGGGSTEEGAG